MSDKSQSRYYWLNINPKSGGAFTNLKIDDSIVFKSTDPDGKKRNNQYCFRSIQKGDKVVAYETKKRKEITAICVVIEKEEQDDYINVDFQKTKNYDTYLGLDTMKSLEGLEACELVQDPLKRVGTLFELEEKAFHAITKKLNELNSVDLYGELS